MVEPEAYVICGVHFKEKNTKLQIRNELWDFKGAQPSKWRALEFKLHLLRGKSLLAEMPADAKGTTRTQSNGKSYSTGVSTDGSRHLGGQPATILSS